MADRDISHMFEDMVSYTKEVSEQAHSAAKSIQKEMKAAIIENSPVRQYPAVVRKIDVHRHPPQIPKAIKSVRPSKYQPGAYKNDGWRTATKHLKGSGRVLYGVSNKKYTLTHLIDLGHKGIAHGKYFGEVEGLGFVEKVQEWGEKQLDGKLKEFLKKE